MSHLMVGAINPNSTQTLDAQIRSAKQAKFQVAPGEKIPAEASVSLVVPTASASPLAPAMDNPGSTDFSKWAIAGITLGAVAFLVLCAGFLVRRLRRRRKVQDEQQYQEMDGTNVTIPTTSTLEPAHVDAFSPTSPCSPILPLFSSRTTHPAFR